MVAAPRAHRGTGQRSGAVRGEIRSGRTFRMRGARPDRRIGAATVRSYRSARRTPDAREASARAGRMCAWPSCATS